MKVPLSSLQCILSLFFESSDLKNTVQNYFSHNYSVIELQIESFTLV